MRIISGLYAGRNLKSPPGTLTHPMSEKMRGAIFNTLGDIAGLDVLDAFAGTGAIGFEALSRGARLVAAIEQDRAARTIILLNLTALIPIGAPYTLEPVSILQWLARSGSLQFDIIIADPPYDDLQPETVARLPERLKQGGILVLSWPDGGLLPEMPGMTQIKQKTYGDSQLIYYRKS
jgi:16S rRNA (guanine966-N2)-methyltransferase